MVDLIVDPACWVALTFAGAVFMLAMAGLTVTPITEVRS